MASIKLQFEPLVQEKNTVDAQNQGYLSEITEVKKKINDFTEIRNQLRVSICFLWGINCMIYLSIYVPLPLFPDAARDRKDHGEAVKGSRCLAAL